MLKFIIFIGLVLLASFLVATFVERHYAAKRAAAGEPVETGTVADEIEVAGDFAAGAVVATAATVSADFEKGVADLKRDIAAVTLP